MKNTPLYVALPTEPERKIRSHRSLAIELSIKNRERMKRHVWEKARKKGLLHGAKPVSLV